MKRILASLLLLVLELPVSAGGLGDQGEGGIDREAWQKAVAQAFAVARREPLPKFKRPSELQGVSAPEDFERTITKSISELGHPEVEVQQRARRVLEYLGPEAFDACTEALAKSENPRVRRWAANILGARGRRAVEALRQAFRNDPDPLVREYAAGSLGNTRSPKAIPALVEALNDPDQSVRWHAILSLRRVGDRRALKPLAALFESDKGRFHRYQIARALVEIDYEFAKEALLRWAEKAEDNNLRRFLLRLAENPPRTSDSRYPGGFADVFGLARDARTIAGERYGKGEILRLLMHIESSNWHLRSACVGALGHLDAPSAVPAIVRASERHPGREEYYSALARIATPKAIECLLSAARSADLHTKKVAVQGLGYGGRWAVPLLIVLLDDPDLRLRHPEDKNLEAMVFSLTRWPDGHVAHHALLNCLAEAGFKVQHINLATGGYFNVDKEIAGLKKWWATYGEQFLEGQPVPSPKISSVFLSK